MTSERWAGFSDEDIERIKSNQVDCDSCNDRICEIDDLGATSKNRRPMKIKQMPLKKLEEYPDDDNAICNDGMSKEFSPTDNELASRNSVGSFIPIDKEENCSCNGYTICNDTEQESTTVNNLEIVFEEMDNHQCKDLDQSKLHLLPLEIFEMRQKHIEAENARRRALINKAINDKKMRTQAEAVKLAKITHELNRIDSSLSADVSILRDYIEKASLEFSEAEKRYLKAEKEFVEAKMILFEKMQRKEMLTEHLCAIIEQNENRKADKLVELMKQLEMEVMLDECAMNGVQPILPNLCALNDEPYHSCQTIKPHLSKDNSQHSVHENSHREEDEKLEETEQVGEISERVEGSIPNNLNTTENSVIEGTEEKKVQV